ncbi:hypothetical protein E2C01_024415 [Portunus trituberculatus]|uniref:Uncharacterized protein n=1 Tax=Portunus trituberculatus TaxID=210409 RepID=A0A5B7ED41_PORTR|nr:hypothetical protein [Portunus trituberculatus]
MAATFGSGSVYIAARRQHLALARTGTQGQRKSIAPRNHVCKMLLVTETKVFLSPAYGKRDMLVMARIPPPLPSIITTITTTTTTTTHQP